MRTISDRFCGKSVAIMCVAGGCYRCFLGRRMMVDSIVATSVRSLAPVVKTSAGESTGIARHRAIGHSNRPVDVLRCGTVARRHALRCRISNP
jgi:hypothetical protein